MKFVAKGHVRETGGRLTQIIEARNERHAITIGIEWARENDLVLDGVETQKEHDARAALTATHQEITQQIAKGIKSMLEDAIAESAFEIDLDNVVLERDRTLGKGYRINVTHGTTPVVAITVEAIR